MSNLELAHAAVKEYGLYAVVFYEIAKEIIKYLLKRGESQANDARIGRSEVKLEEYRKKIESLELFQTLAAQSVSETHLSQLITTTRARSDEILHQIGELAQASTAEEKRTKAYEGKFTKLVKLYNSSYELYLGAINNLCSQYLTGKINAETFKVDWYQTVRDIVYFKNPIVGAKSYDDLKGNFRSIGDAFNKATPSHINSNLPNPP